MEITIQERQLGWVRWLPTLVVGAAGIVLLAIGPIGTREMCSDSCAQMPDITGQIIGSQLVIAAAFLTGLKPKVKSQILASVVAAALFAAAYSIVGSLMAVFYFLGVWAWLMLGIPVLIGYLVLLAVSLTVLLVMRKVRRKRSKHSTPS